MEHRIGGGVAYRYAGNRGPLEGRRWKRHHFYSWITQDITVNISRWHNNSLTVINTGLVHHGIRQRSIWTPSALRPVLQQQLNINSLITHRFPLSQAQEAFKTAAEDSSAIKVMVVPD